MKSLKLLIVSFVLLSGNFTAQNFSWLNSAGGTYDDLSAKVVHGTKNFYLYGNFEGNISLTNTESGSPVQLTNHGWGTDIFLISVDSIGKVVWAKSFGGNDYDTTMGSVRFNLIDSTLLLVGTHTNDFYYGPGTSDFVGLYNGAGQSVAFLKIRENGDVVNVHTTTQYGLGFQYLNDYIERGNDIFISGMFSGNLTFSKKNGSGDTTITGPLLGTTMQPCIVSLDENFKLNFYTSTPEYIYKMEFDSLGNMYGIGSYEWNDGTSWYWNSSLIKLSPTGVLRFSKPIKTKSYSYAKYSFLNIVSNNNISFTTHSSDTTFFDNINLYTSPLAVWSTHSQFEFFSLRLDSIGNITKLIPYETGTNKVNQVDFNMNALGESYFTIPYWGTVSINGNTYTSNGLTDVLLYAFDVNANMNWVQSFGSTGFDYCNSITFDKDNSPVLHGTFESSITVTQTTNKTTTPISINSNGGRDVFYAKINRTTSIPTSLTSAASNSSTINLYPSPASNKLCIKINEDEDKYSLDLFNSLGQQVVHETVSSGTTQIDVSTHESGIYIYKVYNNKNFNQCGKILILH